MAKDKSKIEKRIGQALKETRRSRKITQQNLAKEIGIAYQQIQKYENGRNRVSLSRLLEMLSVYKMSIIDFVILYPDLFMIDLPKKEVNILAKETAKLSMEKNSCVIIHQI